MSDKDIELIANKAKIIVSGYAFMEMADRNIRILNLDHPDCAMIVNRAGEIIETNMDLIEQKVVLDLCSRNLQFMGE